jgi:hypothetical protein
LKGRAAGEQQPACCEGLLVGCRHAAVQQPRPSHCQAPFWIPLPRTPRPAPQEFYALLSFATPGVLGPMGTFKRVYAGARPLPGLGATPAASKPGGWHCARAPIAGLFRLPLCSR